MLTWLIRASYSLQCLASCLFLVASGCQYSELWRHRQETIEIQTRLSEKQHVLNELNDQQTMLRQQNAEFGSEIKVKQTTLEELSRQSEALEIQLQTARITNKKLNYNVDVMEARNKFLQNEIAALQKEHSKQVETSNQADVKKEQRIVEIKSELDTLLKIIAQQ